MQRIVRYLRRHWIILLFAVLHIVIFMILFGGAFPDQEKVENMHSSRSLYFFYADRILDGDVPYHDDFAIEYAPVSLGFFLLPRVFADGNYGYHIAFAVQILLLDLLALVLLADLGKRLGYPSWGTLLGGTLVLLAIGPMVVDHFDLIAAIMFLLAVYSFVRGWNMAAWVMIGLGAMTKIYPILLVPVLLIYLLRRGDRRRIITGGAALAVVLVGVSLPGMIIDFGGFADSFTYHSDRGLQAESTYASVLFLAHDWGLTTINADYVDSSGSYDIVTSPADTLASRVSPLLTGFALIAVWLSYGWAQLKGDLTDDKRQKRLLICFALLTLVAFLVFNKVFSPQYIIWLYPIVAVAGGGHRGMLVLAFATLALLTQEIYPYRYPGPVGRWVTDHIFAGSYWDLVEEYQTRAIWLLAARNLGIVACAAFLWWRCAATRQIQRLEA